MPFSRPLTSGNHRALAAAVVTGMLAVGGAASVAVALSSQQHAPQAPLSTAAVPTLLTVPTVPTVVAASGHEASARRPAIVGPVLPASAPVSIAIPAIGVTSVLLNLGRTPGGALEVAPPGPTYDEAGWYRYSPTPGSLGPAVIAGHVDSAAGGPSVFFRLGGLRSGDRISVARADHSVATFVVDDVHRYHKSAFPTAMVYGNTDHAALRLITCGGAFDSGTGHYLDNVVVRASLIN